jgi:hypothetical protein
MKFRALLIAPLLLTLAASAQDAVPPRELIVAAIGEVPVPKMKITTVGEFRGYKADMESTNQWFPQEWSVAGHKITLTLNTEPASMKTPGGKEPISLAPIGTAPKIQSTAPALLDASDNPDPTGKGPTLMVIFNREMGKPWNEGFASRSVVCSKLNPAIPSAMVMNLSGAVLTITAGDRKIQQITPGKCAVAMVLVNPKNGLKLLPLSAAAAGKTYSLDVVPLDFRAPWCPVIAVYPSTGPSSKTRPLQVALIQPSDAVPIKQAKAPVAK